MSRYRPHHSLGQRQVIRLLYSWAKKHFKDSVYRPNQKISDAQLVALLLSRLVFKHPYGHIWWAMLKDRHPSLPSYTQAFNRGHKLLEQLETVAMPSQRLTHAVIDSAPIPVCRPKRTPRCRFPGARWGYATQGEFYGYKLHAWVTLAGQIIQYLLRPANQHDATAAYALNARWADFHGPQVVGDKGYCCLGFIDLPESNTRYDTGWRDTVHGPMRKRIETVFSQPVEAHLRLGQLKTLTSLRLKVVLAHNLCHP